jgi:hypothetical protein
MQPALHPARVSALVAIVSAIVLAVGLAAPRPASAGEYTIYACQADAGYVSGSEARGNPPRRRLGRGGFVGVAIP